MKKLIFKTIEMLAGATVHADHSAIKGNKSGGMVDNNSYKHWRKEDGSSSGIN